MGCVTKCNGGGGGLTALLSKTKGFRFFTFNLFIPGGQLQTGLCFSTLQLALTPQDPGQGS